MLGADCAALYEVEPRTLIQAVKHNHDRFPPDFMFQLSNEEVADLKSQNVIASPGWGGARRANPHAFTEQGVAMPSSVLRSTRAVAVHLKIMHAFVRLRQRLATRKDLAREIEAMKERYDAQFKVVFDALRALMDPPSQSKPRAGFRAGDDCKKTTKTTKGKG